MSELLHTLTENKVVNLELDPVYHNYMSIYTYHADIVKRFNTGKLSQKQAHKLSDKIKQWVDVLDEEAEMNDN